MPDVFISQKQDSHISPQDSQEKKEEKTPPVLPKREGVSYSKFSSFCMYPRGIDFESREDKEEIILMLRQHPIINLKWIFFTLLLLTGPTLLGKFGVFSFLPVGFPLIITLAWYLVTSAYAIEGFFHWYFNVYFITTEGVIDVDFYNLINKRVSDAELDKIQDVSYSTGGVLGTILNFGDVRIQTAAEISEFNFELVPSPEKVAKILDDLMDKV